MELVVHKHGIDFHLSWRTYKDIEYLYDNDVRVEWTNDAHIYTESFKKIRKMK